MSEQRVFRTLELHGEGFVTPPDRALPPLERGMIIKHQSAWTPTKLMAPFSGTDRDGYVRCEVWVLWECVVVLEAEEVLSYLEKDDVFRFKCQACDFDFHMGGLDLVASSVPACVKCGGVVNQLPKAKHPQYSVCTCVHYATGIAHDSRCKVHGFSGSQR